MASANDNLLATPTFSSGPNDKVATTDVYTQDGKKQINSIQSVTDGPNLSVAGLLRGGKSLLNLIPVVQGVAQDGSLLSGKGTFASQVLNSSSFISKSLGRVNGNPQLQGIVESITGNKTLSFGDTFVKANGLVRRVAGSNLKDIRSISSVMGEATRTGGLFEITDKDSDAAVYSGLLSDATRYGIPSSWQQVASAVNSSTTLSRIMSGALPSAIKYSDSTLLADMARGTSGNVNLLNPGTVRDFGQNYQAPLQCTADGYQQEYGNVMDAFRTVDNGWDSKVRNNGGVRDNAVDITTLRDVSGDMNQLIKTGSQNSTSNTEKLYSLANEKFGSSVADQFARDFPNTYTKDSVISPQLQYLRENTTIN